MQQKEEFLFADFLIVIFIYCLNKERLIETHKRRRRSNCFTGDKSSENYCFIKKKKEKRINLHCFNIQEIIFIRY